MKIEDLIVIALLSVVFIYGLANFVLAPIILRRFYKEHCLSDLGRSTFDIHDSQLLKPLATNHLYGGIYRNHQLHHAKCFLQQRPRFTFSKHVRKKLQSHWSATILTVEQELPAFTLLPKSEPETIALMLSDPGVDLSHDTELERRYLLRTDHAELITQLLVGDIRELLVGRELLAIEVFNKTVLIRRSWPTEKILSTLLDDFNCTASIVDANLTQMITND